MIYIANGLFERDAIFQKSVRKLSKIGKATPETMVKLKLKSKNWVLAQCSIISSVAVEMGYRIHPYANKFVNGRGDAWENNVLRENYKTYIGAYNCINHVQKHLKSVGIILDAKLRRVSIDEGSNYVYYVDILVATHRDFKDLCSAIIKGSIKYLSMGCDCESALCSRCGKEVRDGVDYCDHLLFDRRKYYIDEFGKKRIVAELVGSSKDAGSKRGNVVFTEASYLTEPPAFGGAQVRNIIPTGNTEGTIEVMFPEGAISKPAVERFILGK